MAATQALRHVKRAVLNNGSRSSLMLKHVVVPSQEGREIGQLVAQDQTGSFASNGVVSSLASASSRFAITSRMNVRICNAASCGRMLVLLMVRPSCLV